MHRIARSLITSPITSTVTATPRLPCIRAAVRRSFASPALLKSHTQATPPPPSAPLQTEPPRPEEGATEAAPLVDQPLQLRAYQEECIQAVLTHVDQGHRRMGISLATGSGKTVIFTQLISRLKHPSRPTEATQTLVLAHRTELVQQAYEHCRRSYPKASIEIEMAHLHSSGAADITIASVASIVSQDRIQKFDPKTFKLILIDEAHHAVAPRYLDTLHHFGVLNMDEGNPEEKPIVVGVSATLSRFDGLALGKVLDYVVYHRGYADMIQDKWLSPVMFTTVETNVDLSKVGTGGGGGDFRVGELSEAVNTERANEVTVRSWLEKARNRKSTIVFCVDIAHVNAITAKFRDYQIDARPVTSLTLPQDRKDRLEAFRRGEFQVIVNCGVFTEGTDIPNIDCVLLARPTRSKNLLVQMIGRGMRLHPGKKNCHVIDMAGNVDRGVVTVPTLIGLDPDEILTEETAEQAKKRVEQRLLRQKLEEERQEQSPEANIAAISEDPDNFSTRDIEIFFTHYPTVFELLANQKQDRFIRKLSKLSWVSLGRTYILGTKNGIIKIFPSPDNPALSDVVEMRALPREVSAARFARPTMLLSGAPDLEVAVRAADTYALFRYPRTLLEHRAPWRREEATPGQIKMLQNMHGYDPDKPITKGNAVDSITRMVHGGISRWQKAEKVRKKIEKTTKKVKGSEEVRVGWIPDGTAKEDRTIKETRKEEAPEEVGKEETPEEVGITKTKPGKQQKRKRENHKMTRIHDQMLDKQMQIMAKEPKPKPQPQPRAWPRLQPQVKLMPQNAQQKKDK